MGADMGDVIRTLQEEDKLAETFFYMVTFDLDEEIEVTSDH